MALDAAAVRALVTELQCLVSGRVDKIHQPERDEIVIHIRTRDSTIGTMTRSALSLFMMKVFIPREI